MTYSYIAHGTAHEGELQSIPSNVNSVTISATYHVDAYGRLDKTTYNSGDYTARTYDGASRVTEIHHKDRPTSSSRRRSTPTTLPAIARV